MESPPCLSRHSIQPGCVQGQGATGIDSNAMFLSAPYISAQLNRFYRDIDVILSRWFLQCAHTLVVYLCTCTSQPTATEPFQSPLYDTIRYDTVYLTCSKKLTGSQLSPPHGTNKKLKCETKNKMIWSCLKTGLAGACKLCHMWLKD